MHRHIRKLFIALAAITWSGCSNAPSGPASIQETSEARSELTDRVATLEKYVTFRRTYEELDYDIMYQNNSSGMVPGPSDWDVRLVAQVPRSELKQWVPKGATKFDGSAQDWVTQIPGSIRRDGITEWYRSGGTIVGFDRDGSIVAYRNSSTPP